jgi:trk system potassium uptake protein TrkA
MYAIVVGLGRVGQYVVEFLVPRKHTVVAVDLDPERCREITSRFDVVAIPGDATAQRILEQAGASKADSLIATTSDDSVNFMAAHLARSLGVKHLVSVLNHREHQPLFAAASIALVENPEMEVAKHLYWAVERPNVRDLLRLGEEKVEMFEVTVGGDSDAADKNLGELKLADATVVAIERKNKLIIPRGDTRVQPGDKVTVFAAGEAVEKLATLFVGKGSGKK